MVKENQKETYLYVYEFEKPEAAACNFLGLQLALTEYRENNEISNTRH